MSVGAIMGLIALLVVGAVLAFMIDGRAAGVDIRLVGYVLMGCGLIGLVSWLATVDVDELMGRALPYPPWV